MMTCLLFCKHLDTLLAEGNFSLDLYIFKIFQNLVTFSSFSVKVVFKSCFFHNFSLKYCSKFTYVVYVSTSCFDEVILAEIVFSGSQFITKFDQIFYHILTDLILLFLLFCFMTFFQDNHKLVKARFV